MVHLRVSMMLFECKTIVKETGKNFNDEAHIIYVNAQIQDETALGKLMHDFFCVNADNMKYSILAERVRYFKETKKGVVDMSSVMEKASIQSVISSLLMVVIIVFTIRIPRLRLIRNPS